MPVYSVPYHRALTLCHSTPRPGRDCKNMLVDKRRVLLVNVPCHATRWLSHSRMSLCSHHTSVPSQKLPEPPESVFAAAAPVPCCSRPVPYVDPSAARYQRHSD